MEVKEAIKTRRSVREFCQDEVTEAELLAIIEAGRWAPSGLNNQPWQLVVVRQAEIKEKLAGLTKYSRVIQKASVNLVVFYDETSGYDQCKDTLAIGAFIQNMLLAAHSLGLGSCWLGEILKAQQAVKELLELPVSFQLMAVIALGKPTAKKRQATRRPIDEIIFKTII